ELARRASSEHTRFAQHHRIELRIVEHADLDDVRILADLRGGARDARTNVGQLFQRLGPQIMHDKIDAGAHLVNGQMLALDAEADKARFYCILRRPMESTAPTILR